MSGSQGAGSAAAADVRLSVPGVEESKVEQPVSSGTPLADISVLQPEEEGDGAFRPPANTARPTWNYQYLSINPSNPIPGEYAFNFPERDIKMAICVTGYNEPFELLNGTLEAIQRNLDKAEVFTKGNLKPSNVLVFVVFDGRSKASKDIFVEGGTSRHHNTYFTMERDYSGMERMEEQAEQAAQARAAQARQAEARVAGAGGGVQVVHQTTPKADAHVYEAVLRLNKDNSTAYETEMQLMMCFKVKNGGKIDSHRWYFYALCQRIAPKYCFIVDMGTNPSDDAILRLFNDMEENQQIGGCCGQIAIDTKTSCCASLDPIVSAQVYEYKASNFLDKSMESVFGFISVLPGAFSAYRYDAIREHADDPHAPLHEYFKLADMSESALMKVSPWTANMYLAEDRILGFEMLARKGYDWTLHYNSAALAYTDCPDNLAAITSQRRRWLNGSFFASTHVVRQALSKLWHTNHTMARKFALTVLFLYSAIQVALTFFLLGNSYLIFVLTLQLVIPSDKDHWVVLRYVASTMYLLVTATQFVFALGNSPQDRTTRDRVNRVYTTSAVVYAVLFLYATIAVFFKADEFSTGVFLTGIFTIGAIYVAALVHGDFLTLLRTTLQFWALIPTYLNVFTIYSFCNIHDISWGTRASNAAAEQFQQQREEVFKFFRSLFVMAWVGLNVVLVSFVLYFEADGGYSTAIVFMVVVFLGGRFTGSVTYVLLAYGKKVSPTRCRRRHPPAANGVGAAAPPTGV